MNRAAFSVALTVAALLLVHLAQAQELYVRCTSWGKEVPLSPLMDSPNHKYSRAEGPGYGYYVQWVIGYASGAAALATRLNLPGADRLRIAADESGTIGIASWVTRYCVDHPSAN